GSTWALRVTSARGRLAGTKRKRTGRKSTTRAFLPIFIELRARMLGPLRSHRALRAHGALGTLRALGPLRSQGFLGMHGFLRMLGGHDAIEVLHRPGMVGLDARERRLDLLRRLRRHLGDHLL